MIHIHINNNIVKKVLIKQFYNLISLYEQIKSNKILNKKYSNGCCKCI